jgi:hypothetical protein
MLNFMNIGPVVLVLSHEDRQTHRQSGTNMRLRCARSRNLVASLCSVFSSNLLRPLLEAPISCHVISSLSLVIHVIHSERDEERRGARDATYCNGDEYRRRKNGTRWGGKEDLPTFSIPFYFI